MALEDFSTYLSSRIGTKVTYDDLSINFWPGRSSEKMDESWGSVAAKGEVFTLDM